MGRFSGTQPSSVGFCGDYSSDNEIQALIEQDQTQLGHVNTDQYREEQAPLAHLSNEINVYPPQPQTEFGFPRRCYCGTEPHIATCYSRTDPGRRYFTCPNVEDGDCHVWKWWDDAVMEEMRNADTHIGQLADKVDALNFFSDNETDQKLLRLENMMLESDQKFGRLENVVCELAKNKSTSTFDVFVAVMVMVLILIGMVLIVV
ncbi:hypothetical protein Bca4012_035753 [Brassica carinata]